MISEDKTLMLNIDGVQYQAINNRLEAVENSNRELHAEIRTLSEKLDLVLVRLDGMNSRIEDMKFYVSLTFGALAVFVAFAALVPAIAKFIHSLRRPSLTVEQVREMIDEAMTRTSATR